MALDKLLNLSVPQLPQCKKTVRIVATSCIIKGVNKDVSELSGAWEVLDIFAATIIIIH